MNAPASFLRAPIAAILFLALGSAALSQITIIGRWRLGENDSGAGNGVAAIDPTIDFSGNGWNLNRESTAIAYSSDTPSASLTPLGASTLSMNFDGTGSYGGYSIGINGWNENMPAYANNVVIEAWIKPSDTNAGSREIIGLGTQTSGYQIMQSGTNLEFRYGTSSAAVYTYSGLTTSAWTYVGLVIDNNQAALYVNGASSPTYSTASMPALQTTSHYFSIGEMATTPGGENFVGLIDEARYFTFNTGTFTPAMLNYGAIPEPSTWALLLGFGALGGAMWRRRRG